MAIPEHQLADDERVVKHWLLINLLVNDVDSGPRYGYAEPPDDDRYRTRPL